MSARVLVVTSAAALVLAACSSSEPQQDVTAPEPTRTTATPLVEASPLTGEPMTTGAPDNPVFVVKIENTDGGAPQYGLDQADLVIEELVEGGLTRLATFFYSNLPAKVGHVRSLRTSDIGIAGPVGGQIVASGGASGAYSKVEGAGITVFSEDAGSPGFSSDPLKVRPYNRLIDLTVVNDEAKRTTINAPYLPWLAKGEKAATAPTKKATAATVRFSPTTSTTWALQDDKWVRTNGHAEAGHDYEADTMIVIACRVGDAGYTDPAGNPVPETVFEGRGQARIFHGDTVTSVTWVKSSLDEGITFETADGSPYEIEPGKAFLELVPEGDGGVTLR